ncbi:hypothetical protein [Rhodoblastus sp.]|uniref:hypothetical protein n=1 Tax=Rhodoblastus sp. TaxID=1962975 RepID=UPI00261948FD|nr:hypothetical protein [Rhodoblastus sp.]
MKPGKAYKLAALASAHRAKAIQLLDMGDGAGAKREDVAYLDCLGQIPSMLRHQMASFFEDCLRIKLELMRR